MVLIYKKQGTHTTEYALQSLKTDCKLSCHNRIHHRILFFLVLCDQGIPPAHSISLNIIQSWLVVGLLQPSLSSPLQGLFVRYRLVHAFWFLFSHRMTEVISDLYLAEILTLWWGPTPRSPANKIPNIVNSFIHVNVSFRPWSVYRIKIMMTTIWFLKFSNLNMLLWKGGKSLMSVLSVK